MRLFLLLLCMPPISLFAQDDLEVEALNRYTISRNDTLYQFYAVKPDFKKPLAKQKKYHWFVTDTILITEYGYDSKLLHGRYSVYYPEKNLKQQGYFKRGLKEGTWKEWWPDGTLRALTNYKGGDKNGQFEEYREGRIARTGSYKNDLLEGEVINYSADGTPERVLYEKGRIVEPDKAAKPVNQP